MGFYTLDGSQLAVELLMDINLKKKSRRKSKEIAGSHGIPSIIIETCCFSGGFFKALFFHQPTNGILGHLPYGNLT